MKRGDLVVIVAAGLVALIVCGTAFVRWRSAEDDATAALSSMRAAERSIARLVELRGRRQTIAAEAKPEQDLIARVNTTLSASGISTSRMKSLTQESDRAVGPEAEGLRQQSVRVVLEPVTTPELGAFLARWREEQPLWTPTRIELNHTGRRDDTVGQYTARLLLAATYIGEIQ